MQCSERNVDGPNVSIFWSGCYFQENSTLTGLMGKKELCSLIQIEISGRRQILSYFSKQRQLKEQSILTKIVLFYHHQIRYLTASSKFRLYRLFYWYLSRSFSLSLSLSLSIFLSWIGYLTNIRSLSLVALLVCQTCRPLKTNHTRRWAMALKILAKAHKSFFSLDV